jgi:hypothetical protein
MQQRLVQDHSAESKSLEPEIEERIDQEARSRSNGDIALWFHHRALLVGAWGIRQRGDVDWRSYLRTKKLEQYSAVEQSVIQGWRKYVQNTVGIPSEKQQDEYALNRALVFDWLS